MKTQVIHKTAKSLSVAVMLGLGIAATSSTTLAVELDNNNRLGDAGIFQYYTATGDWQTFIRIINTSDEAVAVKVRFREAANSREVLDYIIFLSPRDMWAGWTDKDAAGQDVPGVRTSDTSCLYPLPDNNPTPEGWKTLAGNLKAAAFQETGFTGVYDDGGNGDHTSIQRMSEGHIEVIGIAQFSEASDFGRAVSHDNETGKPGSCQSAAIIYESFGEDIAGILDDVDNLDEFIQNAANATHSLLAGSLGLPMNNQLAMNGYLVNVPQGMGGGYDPDILTNFWDCDAEDWLGCFFEDGHGFWDLQLSSLETATDPDMDSAYTWKVLPTDQPRTKQKGREGNQDVTGGVDQVSFEFMRESVINEWAASANPEAVIKDYYTQWVLGFPTKHYYVDLQDDDEPLDDVSPTLADQQNGAYRPFTDEFYGTDSGEYDGVSCDSFVASIWNREERFSTFASPSRVFPTELCYETNVVVFNEAYESKGLGSAFAITIPSELLPTDVVPGGPSTTSERGWAEFDLTGEWDGADEWRWLNIVKQAGPGELTRHRHGLPVTGFLLSVYNTNDTLTNHSAINSHAYRVEEESDWQEKPE